MVLSTEKSQRVLIDEKTEKIKLTLTDLKKAIKKLEPAVSKKGAALQKSSPQAPAHH